MESLLQSLCTLKSLLLKDMRRGQAGGRALGGAGSPNSGGWQHRNGFPGWRDVGTGWRRDLHRLPPSSTALPGLLGLGRETSGSRGCVCRVWFPTSLVVRGVSLPRSQGWGHGPWFLV